MVDKYLGSVFLMKLPEYQNMEPVVIDLVNRDGKAVAKYSIGDDENEYLSMEESGETYGIATRNLGREIGSLLNRLGFIGEGKFIDKNTVEVNGKKLKFKKAIIATGARAAKLDIPGLEESGYLNNETVFNLTKLPKSIGVIGGGPIGCELSQAFKRLGAQVYLFHNNIYNKHLE